MVDLALLEASLVLQGERPAALIGVATTRVTRSPASSPEPVLGRRFDQCTALKALLANRRRYVPVSPPGNLGADVTLHRLAVIHLFIRVELALSTHIALHGIAHAALNVRARDRPFAARLTPSDHFPSLPIGYLPIVLVAAWPCHYVAPLGRAFASGAAFMACSMTKSEHVRLPAARNRRSAV